MGSVYNNIPKDEFTLQYFEAGMFAASLEDAIWSLNILEGCNSDMTIQATLMEMDKLLALKYSVEQPLCPDELAGIKPQDIYADQYKFQKLKADRKLLICALFPIYAALATELNYKPLEQVNKNQSAIYHDFDTMLKDQERYRIQEKELHKRLRVQRNKQNASVHDCDCNIDRLRRLIEDASITLETNERYVGRWQNARAEQHELVLKNKDRVHEDAIYGHKLQIDREMRAHAESEMLVAILIDETLRQVEHWMGKYEMDMERIDLNIQVKRNQLQTMMEHRIHLEEKFARHDKELKAWIQFKIDRKNANEYSDRMNQSAVKVQAWWRGILVRKELGPYKPTKGKKGKKKNKATVAETE